MAKSKILFYCRECGADSPKWLGRCPGCGAWNTLEEERVLPEATRNSWGNQSAKPQLLSDLVSLPDKRITTGIGEFDRVLGGGIVAGSLILLGGDPGIGKSTLMLEAASQVARRCGNVFYVSGEESTSQTGLRAKRTGSTTECLWILSEVNLDVILNEAIKLTPALMVIDSIQTMFSPGVPGAAGSISQLRESTGKLLRFAKESSIPVVLVGHVTKDGSIAGPRLLEHMVDVVLYFEGERNYSFRILRAIKNRFGSTSESGLFSMETRGLAEVLNPSMYLLAERTSRVSGSAVTVCLEGVRPLLVEIQALVSTTCFGMPRRTAAGFDANRLVLLLAVLEKRVGLMLGNQDVYVNAVGGYKLTEPAADLALLLAVASSVKDRVVDPSLAVIGEVGLTGEVRTVPGVEKRAREAVSLGFGKVMVPYGNLAELRSCFPNTLLIGVHTVSEAMEVLAE